MNILDAIGEAVEARFPHIRIVPYGFERRTVNLNSCLSKLVTFEFKLVYHINSSGYLCLFIDLGFSAIIEQGVYYEWLLADPSFDIELFLNELTKWIK